MLPDAFRVIEAWGFTYKSVAFCWVKRNRMSTGWFVGLGFWTRANVELCLLATKGNPRRMAKDVGQIIEAPAEAHSKKPEEASRRIERLLGDVPRLELFARQPSEGWHVWGNEVESDIVLEGGQLNQ